jgi:hydrogenase-4 component B
VTGLGLPSVATEMAWIVVVGAPLLVAVLLAAAGLRPVLVRIAPWTPVPAILVALFADGAMATALDPVLLGARFGADGIARVFLLFSGVLWFLGGLYAQGYLQNDQRRVRFLGFFLCAMAGNLGLIAAQDMATFYALFALMTFSSYGLVMHSGSAEARRASVVYIVMAILGEAALFAAMVLLGTASGTMVFDAMVFAAVPEGARQLATVLALLGLGVKVGVFGLHMWLPLAHPAAPTPASAVLSGAMIKAGVIGWLRFLPGGQLDLPDLGGILITMGVVAALGAVAIGLTQINPKTVLAYSSVSQMGLVTVGLGLGMTSVAIWPAALTAMLLYALHHGLAKGALFLSVGVAPGLPDAGWPRLLMRVGLILPAAALAGLPLTSGAMAKTALKLAAGSADPSWAAVLQIALPISAVGTTLLMVRFVSLIWRAPGDRAAEPTPWLMRWSWALLVVLSATVIWVWPPWLVQDLAAKAMQGKAVWALAWPVLVGLAVALFVMRFEPLRSGLGRVRVPAGDLLTPLVSVGGSAVRMIRVLVGGSPAVLNQNRKTGN